MTPIARRGRNLWIDSEHGSVGATWYWPSEDVAATTAVVIVPGIAHEERTMAGGLVALAEALADAGLPALLIDLHGCAQSGGGLGDADIAACWRAGIRASVRHARANGATRVIVVGVRLGFPLAADALADEPLAALVAWAPIVNGRRYVRELKLLQRATDDQAGAIAIGGFSIPATALDRIAALDLTKIKPPAASYVLLRDMFEGLNAPWLKRLRDCGATVQEQVSSQVQPWLFSGADQPALPLEDIQGLTRSCRALHDQGAKSVAPASRAPAPRPTIEFVHRGRLLRETFVDIGPAGLTGVLTEPADGSGSAAVRLLLSTVGPGRTFTDFARDEASSGNTSLRFDFAGFGTSGRGDGPPGGELYTDSGSHDVRAAIDYLQAAGHRRIYALGFCAGAWSMMQADVGSALRAAVAINTQLYFQPVRGNGTAAPPPTRSRRMRLKPLLARVPLLKAAAVRIRRTANARREPVDWLIRLCSGDAQILLAYAEGDPGLTYLNGQIAQGMHAQLPRPFALRTYADLGHLAEGPTARARLFDDITEFFAGLDRESAADHQSPAADIPVRNRKTWDAVAARPALPKRKVGATR